MNIKLASALVCAVTLLAGCSDSEIHPDKVRAALQGLPDDQKAKLETGLTAVAANHYAAALPPLQSVAFGAKLTKEQRDVLKDTIAKVSAKAMAQK
ncbi:MAG TPA: hypothetical protein VHB20_05045 [Verrucomicrobiae bacterium]|jgi:outer membrane murein-binding lipoprotein Lpp|nr:hypothetical protein [Verrucomicrobiae bacterium]